MPRRRSGPVRYAVVGLGHIAQVAVLPAFAHAARNSRLAAVVSEDSTKRRAIAQKYRVDKVYSYGVYCINAARCLFRAEPKEVVAVSVNSGAKRLAQIDESTGALLRFEGERIAAFVTSFNAADVGSYRTSERRERSR